MTRRITATAYNPATGAITLPNGSGVTLANLELVLNKTKATQRFNPASPFLGATVSGDVITLASPAPSDASNDVIVVYVSEREATEAKLEEVRALLETTLTHIDNIPDDPASDTKLEQIRLLVVQFESLLQRLPSTGAASEAKLEEIKALLGSINGTLAQHGEVASLAPFGQLMMAVRNDADTTLGTQDGDYALLQINRDGRLKTAGAPAQYDPVVGNITASGQSVSAQVENVSNVVAYCTGTFSGSNCAFEASIDGGTTWFGIQAVRTNANTIETTTGSLSAAPVYAWEMSVNAFTNVRVRATAFTSGTQVWRFTLGSYATEPIPAIQPHGISGTVTVSGTVTTNAGFSSSAGGTSTGAPYISTADTNLGTFTTAATAVVAGYASNTGATWAYLKLYNKNSAPVLTTDTPLVVIGIPPGATVPINQAVYKRFSSGVARAITGGMANTDATPVAAGQVLVSLLR